VDPADDGSEVVSAVADRIRAEFLTRIGLEDLLHPAAPRQSTMGPGLLPWPHPRRDLASWGVEG